ncbi:MAG: hypothetical protein ACOYZ8_02615 [Chloroflexota bacterium]
MKRLTLPLLGLAWALAGCFPIGPIPTPLGNPFPSTPTRSPLIVSPTPILVYPTGSPSATPSLTATATSTNFPTGTATAASALTDTATPAATDTVTPEATDTATPTPTASATLAPAAPTVTILGCDAGLDITHGMGEVTNAYVTIANPSGPGLTDVCATLSSTDEGRAHPDKTVCVASLPAGYQVTLKLTIDTTFQVAAAVQVDMTSNEGITASAVTESCTDVGLFPPGSLGTPGPIP